MVWKLKVFADANFASRATDRTSVSGGVVMCGGAAVGCFLGRKRCDT